MQDAHYARLERELMERTILESQREAERVKEAKRNHVKSLTVAGSILGSGEFSTVCFRYCLLLLPSCGY